MYSKPTYQELEKELEEVRLTNKLIEKSSIIRFLWKNQTNWPVEYVSENVSIIFGYSIDDFLREEIVYSDIIHPEDLQRIENEVKDQSKIGSFSIKHKPYRVISKAGEIKWVNDITLIRRNENNEITHFEGIITDITEQKKAETLLKQRENYLTALNKASEISIEGNNIEQIQQIVEIIGKASQASRTYVFRNNKKENGDKKLFKQIAEYTSKGIKPETCNPITQILSYNLKETRWYKILKKGEIINSRVADFSLKEREILEPQKIKSILIIPIIIENVFWGFMGFDNCINDNDWETTEIEYLKAGTLKIGAKIEEHKKLQLIKEENNRFKTTMDSIDAIVYVADMQTHELLFLNQKGKNALTGKIGDKCYSVLQKGQIEPCNFCTNHLLLDKRGKPKKPHVWEFKNTITNEWYQLRDQAIKWTDNRLARIEIATNITKNKENELALINSNLRWKFAVEGNADGLWDWNLITDEVFFSAQWKRLLGFSENEIENNFLEWEKRVHPDDKNKVIEDVNKHRNGDTVFYENEHRLLCKDNTYKWFLDRGKIVTYASDNKPERMIGTLSDITNRKEIELALIENEKRLQEAQKIAKLGYWELDLTTNKLFWSDEIYRIFDLEPHEFEGTYDAFLDKIHPDDKKLVNDEYLNSLKNKIPYKIEHRLLLAKTGKIKHVLERCNTKYDNTGKPILSTGTVLDITERKIAELALKQSEEKYRLVSENISDVIWILNFSLNKFTYISSSVYNLRGYTVEEAMQQNLKQSLTPESAEKVTKQIETGLKKIINNPNEQISSTDELQQTHKNGSVIWIETSTRTKFNSNGELEIFGTSRNIDERKKAQLALLASEAKLRESNNTKDKLFSIISHDLRSPFNAILGFSDLLLENHSQYNNSEREKYITVIDDSAKQAYKLLNNLLHWAKTQTGGIVFNPKEYALNKILIELIQLNTSYADKKNIKLSYNRQLKDINIFADYDMLKIILRNIISNAIKFTTRYGEITINTEQSNGNIIISISDTGIGIKKDNLQKIFHINEITSTTGTENEKGTGLGLILCKEFVEKHGGKIWAESEIGKGSKFTLTIPII